MSQPYLRQLTDPSEKHCRYRIRDARDMGWPALEQSWQRTLDELTEAPMVERVAAGRAFDRLEATSGLAEACHGPEKSTHSI